MTQKWCTLVTRVIVRALTEIIFCMDLGREQAKSKGIA